jgi:hypothetical protein
MADSWKDRERVKEEEFFERQNKEMMKKLRAKGAPEVRSSPVSGEPMKQVEVSGIAVDYCPRSGYVGVDCADLRKLLELARQHDEAWIPAIIRKITAAA